LPNKSEIEEFLNNFRAKLDVFSVIFEDRNKNKQALLDLEITPAKRRELLKVIKPENYSSGPNRDENDTRRPNYWEFGMQYNGKEIYIKINMGFQNKPVICISFHIAERPITYPISE